VFKLTLFDGVVNLSIRFYKHRQGEIIMARPELIEHLNKALSLELTGIIQYSQHSYLVTGTDREVYKGFFRDNANEAQKHAEFLGDKIVALGGIPTVEPAMIRQSTDLKEMLKQNLKLEREAMAAYMNAWNSCGEEDLPTKFWVEGQIAEEQIHIEELEKMTSERTASVSSERIVLREVS
jgi:bacterioferritin